MKKINKIINKINSSIPYKLLIIFISLYFLGSLFFNAGAFYKTIIDIKDNIDKELLVQPDNSEDSKPEECDSDFFDGKWEKDEWWIENEQKFIYKAEKLFGGPKMVFSEKKSSDNFLSSFEFMPIENINNKDKEINLVVYVGNLYKIVFEKIYEKKWKNELYSFDSFYVAYIKNDEKIPEYGTGVKITKLKHNISFDEWSKMKIVQESFEGSIEKKITVEILYFTDNLKNSTPEQDIYVFNVEGTSSFGTLQRDIKIGLQIGEKQIKEENIFITKFNCFKLENR